MRSKRKRLGLYVGVFVTICSIVLNLYFIRKQDTGETIWYYHFPDANSRETYETIHKLSKIKQKYTGAGVKVGILDWGFGYKEHAGLYAGGVDETSFRGHKDNFAHTSEHGYWMAQTLKEIAPNVQIYALGSYSPDGEDSWVDAMIQAIEWAEKNQIDILTLSHEPISQKNRARFDDAVNEAYKHGIVTTFIHYDNQNNILPWGIWSDQDTSCSRSEDVNIFQYDYNMFLLDNYKQAQHQKEYDESYKDDLFISVSSMSVVTAGFVAILKEIDNTKTPEEYKQILIQTSRPMGCYGDKAEHVVDMNAAVKYLESYTK